MTWCNSPESSNLQQQCCKNYKFCSFWILWKAENLFSGWATASQDRPLLCIGHQLNYWETGVWCWAGAKSFLLCSVQNSPYVYLASCALSPEGSFFKGDQSGHEEVKECMVLNHHPFTSRTSWLAWFFVVQRGNSYFVYVSAQDSVSFHSSHKERKWEFRNAWSNTTPLLLMQLQGLVLNHVERPLLCTHIWFWDSVWFHNGQSF